MVVTHGFYGDGWHAEAAVAGSATVAVSSLTAGMAPTRLCSFVYSELGQSRDLHRAVGRLAGMRSTEGIDAWFGGQHTFRPRGPAVQISSQPLPTTGLSGGTTGEHKDWVWNIEGEIVWAVFDWNYGGCVSRKTCHSVA